MNVLAMWRGRKQMTIQELSDSSKVNKATIIRIEQGQVVPNISTLGKLAAALDIDITDLATLNEGEKTSVPRPARYTAYELNKVGVNLLGNPDNGEFFLQCQNCNSTWSPNIQPGGKFPRNYWRCEKGCNSDERMIARLEGKESPKQIAA